MKRTFCCIFLLLLCVFMFSSCEKKKEEPTVIRENAYFREAVTMLPGNFSILMNGTLDWDGERLYTTMWKETEEAEGAAEKVRVSFLPDGSDLREETGSSAGGNFRGYRLSDAVTADYSIDSDLSWVCTLTVKQEENTLFSVDFPGLFGVTVTEGMIMSGDIFMPADAKMITTETGELYLFATNKGVIALDKTGAKVWKTPNQSVVGLISADDRTLCLVQSGGNQKIVELNTKDGTFGNTMALPEELSSAANISSPIIVMDDSRTYSFCVVTQNGVYGVSIAEDAETGALSNTVTMLLRFTDSDLYNGGYGWRILSPTHFIRMNTSWSDGDSISVLTSDGSLPPERKTMELAILNTFRSSFVTDAVVSYNRSQEDYRIHITDYSWMEPDLCKLTFDAEIAAGRIPDLVLLAENNNYDETVVVYERTGLFADLSTLLPSYDDLLGCYTGCFRYDDGRQYVFPLTYNTNIRFANSDYFDGPSTAEEFMAAIDALPEGVFPDYNGFRSAGVSLLSSAYTDFIDFDAATCSFDSPEFKNMLQWAAECSKRSQVTLLEDNIIRKKDIEAWFSEGKTLFADCMISGVADLIRLENALGSKAIPYGYPNAKEAMKLHFRMGDYLAIGATSENKEAAAAFIEHYIERTRKTLNRVDFDYQLFETYSFFTEGDVWDWFEKVKDYVIVYTPTTHETKFAKRNQAEHMTGIKSEITKEDCQRYIDLLSSIDSCCDLLSPVWRMIQDEFLFSENCDPETAADVIQSRARIYISEQFG